ncbi:MAG: hypothetical protein EOO16_09605 [Chitinophagaceae bacterium]|nr:MAG: hypothetical protein EOO16_09605 [Chitinophagaceae bacterium]
MEANIPGIYNYCDRWCERCPLTMRCAVFEMNTELDADAGEPEVEEMLGELGSRLAGALLLLEESAARWEVAPFENSPEAEAGFAGQQAPFESGLDASPLLQACNEYAETVELLFAEIGAWDSQGRELARAAALGIKTIDQGLAEIDLLSDCRHVLAWYQRFIGVKFRRALQGRLSGDAGDQGHQSDWNGSAKVALAAVERSRLALTSLLRLLPDEDRVLGLLALLARIERLGRTEFPDADSFRRPGFDDPTISFNTQPKPY